MSYFGGTGAGKGWNSFNFLISTIELEKVLYNLNTILIVFNSRVEINYDSTKVNEYVNNYDKYINKIFDGSMFVRKNDWKIVSSINMGLLGDRSILTWNTIEKYPEYKKCDLARPIPTLSPMCIFSNGKILSLSTFNEEGYFGIQLNYPKCYSLDKDKHEILYETKDEPEFILYNEIVSMLKNFTKRYSFTLNKIYKKPNIFLSNAVLPIINNHWYMKNNEILVRYKH
jgi:hypothetical protein